MANIFGNYKSPISLNIEFENEKLIAEENRMIASAIVKVSDIHVDEEELIKALSYDRGQYETGYTVGYADGFKEGSPKQGYYIGEFDGYADGNPVYDIWRCSECNCAFEDWDEKPTYKFCPNCGADMRGEKK